MTRNGAQAEAADYLRQPGLRRALAVARTQVERLGRVGGTLPLSELTEEEAQALAGLLATLRRRDRPRTGRPFQLRARDLDDALRATRFELSLPEALELAGPRLELRPERRARERAAADAAWNAALRHPLCQRDERARAWVESLRNTGTLIRTAGADAMSLLAETLDLGDRLPSESPIERTRLATEFAGDPHALDDNRALNRLTLSQLAARADIPRPSIAVERRALWQQFGVLNDPASADVLTLNLRPLPLGPLAQSLLLMRGRHFRLTVGQLTVEPLQFGNARDVFLCENPTVLTAAEAGLGASCPQIICTGGWPSSATWALLEMLASAGARLRHHGDFDWDGVRIARLLEQRFGAQPWRFDATSYRAGVAQHHDRTRRLTGRPVKEEAQPELLSAMQENGLELHEEAVLDDLLNDLAAETDQSLMGEGRMPRT
jgi:uncharacterized protein (TIGR02679 family)